MASPAWNTPERRELACWGSPRSPQKTGNSSPGLLLRLGQVVELSLRAGQINNSPSHTIDGPVLDRAGHLHFLQRKNPKVIHQGQN